MSNIPIEQLLKQATPGPVRVAFSVEVTASHTGIVEGLKRVAYCYNPLISEETQKANAELITRLLNWAHTGGPETLRQLLHWIDEDKPVRLPIDELRLSLDILNGTTTTSEIM